MADTFNSNLVSTLPPESLFGQSEQASLFHQLAKMMESYQSSSFDTMTSQVSMEKESMLSTQQSTQHEAIPFDSPLDQSMGSPASTRDFSNSPFHDYEFEFSGVEDAIMFPDHGTQEMHNNVYLSGMPLFGDLVNQQDNSAPVAFTTASQHVEEVDRLNNGNPCDFSFDAMTTGNVAAASAAAAAMNSPSPSVSSSQGSGSESINQLAAVFVREYARTHPLNDIDVLLRALRGAGIEVSDQVIADILASTSIKSESPSFSSASSPMSSQQSPCCDHQHRDSTPISPMTLPASAVSAPVTSSTTKTRSSLQSSVKEHLVIDTRYGKRFVCSICNKQFDRAFNLRTHAMTHIDPDERDKPFMCPWSECAKSFSRKYDAERHYRSVHLKKGEVASKQQVLLALSGRLYQDDEDDSPSNG